MNFTTTTEGRAWDCLADGNQSGRVIRFDGADNLPSAGMSARFWTGDVRKVLAVSVGHAGSGSLRLDAPVSVPDNCGVWFQ